MNNNLKHTVLITDIEEHYTAVVTDIFNPARNSDLLSDCLLYTSIKDFLVSLGFRSAEYLTDNEV